MTGPGPAAGRCRSGAHILELAGTIMVEGRWGRCRGCQLEAEARYRRRRFAARHEGHDAIITSDGRPCCRTCVRGDADVDEIAVERAVAGDAPPRLRPAEREAAVVILRGRGLSWRQVADRTGGSVAGSRTAYARAVARAA